LEYLDDINDEDMYPSFEMPEMLETPDVQPIVDLFFDGPTNKVNDKKDYVKWIQISEKGFKPGLNQKEFLVIPPGIYDIKHTKEDGYIINGKDICLDELFVLPSPEQEQIMDDIQTFWARKKYFERFKYTYKRGILLYGPAGSGKSSIINLVAKELVEKHKGIVLYLNSVRDLEYFVAFMPMLRQIEPDKQILCVLEDIEGFVAYRESESMLLNVLDGMNQMDNVFYLATTNFPEELKERILNRPSRFDRRYEVGFPNEKVREAYFRLKLSKEDLPDEELKKWVEETENLSIAHLGEVVKSVFALGNTFDQTMELLKDMKKKLSSFDFNKDKNNNIGFKSRTYK
jgi:DNA polymerase III delta prime subunit